METQPIHKEKFWKRHENIWKSIAINIVVLVLMLLIFDLRYETADDYFLAETIALDKYYYFPFTNFFLNSFVGFIQSITPFWNAWSGCQIVFSFFAFVIITYVFLAKSNYWFTKALGIFVVFVFSYDHYVTFEFTKTAALLMVAGFLLIVFSIIHRKHFAGVLIGLLSLYIGACYRYSGFIAILAFAILAVILFTILNVDKIDKNVFVMQKRKMVKIGCILVLILGVSGMNSISNMIDSSTPELKNYIEYSHARSGLTDFPIAKYSDNKERYNSLGINRDDLEFMVSRHMDPDTIASYENLKQIRAMSIEQKRYIIGDVVVPFFKQIRSSILHLRLRGLHIMFSVLLLIFVLVFYKKRMWIVPFGVGVLFLALYGYLFYLGRPLYRATYLIDLSTIVWVLFLLDENCLKVRIKGRLISSVVKHRVQVIFIVLIVLISSFTFVHRNAVTTAVKPTLAGNEVMNYVYTHQDKFFITDRFKSARYYNEQYYYKHPLAPLLDGFERNLAGLGQWPMMSPYQHKKMAEHDLSNLFGDIIDNDDVFLIYDDVSDIEKFFNRHYTKEGEEIYLYLVERIDDYKIWQVKSRPINQ
jgi:hypothetical protein